jgi:spermidine synthase
VSEFLKTNEVRERYSHSSGWFYETGKTLYSGKTAFQEITLIETAEFGTTLLLDGATQVMEKNEFQYHEAMVHLPMLAHSNPQKILVIGGGDGGILREVLKHNTVNHIDFVELDEEVVAFAKTHLKMINAGAFDDLCVKTHFTDGRIFVENAPAASYDIIIMDMTDPSGPSLKLYTKEFFTSVQKLLKNDESLFIMHSESPETRPAAFARIHNTLQSVFSIVRGAYTFVRMYGTLWSFAIASSANDPRNVSPELVVTRIAERNIGRLRLISPESWQAFFAEYPYIQEMLKTDGDISTDSSPDFPDTFDPRS